MQALVFIPTRNRSDLARRACESVLAQPRDALHTVLLSDNSDDAAEQQRLEAWAHTVGAPLVYVRPPRALNMGDHWDWAFGEAVRRRPTHILLLTDRMLMRAGALAELARISVAQPDATISYLHDRIDDLTAPVTLDRQRWSGAVLRVASRHLLELTQRCTFHTCLPRLMNALTPVAAFETVRRTYGNYCQAISPDFGFGYRYLATHPDFLFYDKALIVHYAISRSNGAATTRGVLSADAANFRRVSMGGHDRLPHAPYPEMMTLGNFILEEYGQARAGNPAAGLGPVETGPYVKMLYNDIVSAEDPAFRAQQLDLLMRRGHARAVRVRRVREVVKRRTRGLERAVRRLVKGPGRAPQAQRFADVEAALAYDREHPVPRLGDVSHLQFLRPELVQPAGPA